MFVLVLAVVGLIFFAVSGTGLFCICAANYVDNLGMFLLLLSSALDTGSRPFLLLRLL